MIVVGSMISLGYYLPVIAAMWMREAPAGAGEGEAEPTSGPAPPGPGALPVLAGGSPELDEEPSEALSTRRPQPEVLPWRWCAGRRRSSSA